MSAWTDERVAELRKLWGDGVSAGRIAAQLRGELTRNAVIGKVHRLGLAARPRTASQGVAPRTRMACVKPKAPVVLKAQPRPVVAPPPMFTPLPEVPKLVTGPNVVRFLAVAGQRCRYIVDQSAPIAERMVCGNPTAGGSSWCPACQGRVFARIAEPADAQV
jgi:GcrA cell cycle regulator